MQIEDILVLIQGLNHRTRQEIIMLFQVKNEYCVTDIASYFNLSRPTISHHLNLMKRSNILVSRKEGKEIFFSFNKDFVIGNLETLVSYLKGCC